MAIGSSEASVEFHWSDGTILKRRAWVNPVSPDYTAQHLLNLPPAQPDPATDAKYKELAVAARQRMIEKGLPLPPPEPEGRSLMTSFEISPELTNKFAAPPAVQVAVRLQTARAELLVEVPLKAGARQTGHGVRVQVLKMEIVDPDKRADQMSVTVVNSQPARIKFIQCLLVDRVHGTVKMEPVAGTPSFPMLVLPVVVNRATLRLNIPLLWRGDKWIGAPEWLENDTLAAVTYRPEGGFDRELHTDRLEFLKK